MYGLQRYLSIEQEFINARYYISFENKSAYSEFFTREVIILGAEIESAFKVLCNRIDGSTPGNIAQYKSTILNEFPGLVRLGVCNRKTNEITYPFSKWDIGALQWWDVYTSIKHNAICKEATVDVSLSMLQAFELLLFCIEATIGDFSIEYMEMPRLYIPDFPRGIALTTDMQARIRFSRNHIIDYLRDAPMCSCSNPEDE